MRSALMGLASIEDLAVRVAAARERLQGSTVDVVVDVDRLVREACAGRVRARRAMLGCAIALAQDDGASWIDALAAAAEEQRLACASAILRRAGAHHAIGVHGRLPDPHPTLFRGIPGRVMLVTRWRSRASDPVEGAAPPPRYEWLDVRRCLRTMHQLEPMLMNPDPLRVRKMLSSPGLELGEALVIASRRPSSEKIVRELCAQIRWMARVEMREAMVANPFTPTGIALKLLPTIRRPSRRGLAKGPMHPLVAAAMRVLAA